MRFVSACMLGLRACVRMGAVACAPVRERARVRTCVCVPVRTCQYVHAACAFSRAFAHTGMLAHVCVHMHAHVCMDERGYERAVYLCARAHVRT